MKNKILNKNLIVSVFAMIVVMIIGMCFSITAYGASEPKLNKTSLTLAIDESYNLVLKNADEDVEWFSSNKSIAKVDSEGVVTGVKSGTTTIIATYDGKEYECSVKVLKYRVKVKNATMIVGDTQKASLIGTYDDTAKIKWSSSDKTIATVSSNGKITAVSDGKVKIYAHIDGKKYSKTIKIVDGVNVSLNKSSASIKVGKTLTLKATTSPSDIDTDLTWSSSNTKVASVSNKGIVKGLKAGTATITVKTSDGNKATCKITVKKTSYAKPVITTVMTDKTDSDCGVVVMYIKNEGKADMKIMSEYAMLMDADYDSFNRDLQLADVDGNLKNSITIKAGEEKYIAWYVRGARTWYDYKTYVCFNFEYDTKKYSALCCERWGIHIYE